MHTFTYTGECNHVSFLNRSVCNSWYPGGLIVSDRTLLTKTDRSPERCLVSFKREAYEQASVCVCVCVYIHRHSPALGPLFSADADLQRASSLEGRTLSCPFLPFFSSLFFNPSLLSFSFFIHYSHFLLPSLSVFHVFLHVFTGLQYPQGLISIYVFFFLQVSNLNFLFSIYFRSPHCLLLVFLLNPFSSLTFIFYML